ncbi:hypothetical protein [Pedobacter roseus]|uniref:Uncharacterized protein n=1 Tax=Pedobacter roseus TaxID=336820 RepID=A0A7G9QL10_9SPHI|nr:hypothetical protein [Pedobacter roseus]QNN44035.1 hypothetical protein H9L23_08150 [Pedobacter roseus]
MKKVSPTLISMFIAFLALGCNSTDNTKQWDNAHLDPGLPKNLIYNEMNKEEEIYSFFEKHNGSKRTSDVSYLSRNLNEKQDSPASKLNNCRAYYSGSDTLFIDIGISDGFTGSGLNIKYKNKRFNAEAYEFTDVIIEGEVKPKQKVINQKLVLNKANYKIGDSLFGRIEFKSIEINNQGDTILHISNGNFRTRVRSSFSD